MYDFSAISTEVVSLITDYQAVIVATTLVGGTVAAKIGGALGFRFLRKLIGLAH
jgi:hypothetical protein